MIYDDQYTLDDAEYFAKKKAEDRAALREAPINPDDIPKAVRGPDRPIRPRSGPIPPRPIPKSELISSHPSGIHEIHVGNIGNVHTGEDPEEAERIFNEYINQSQNKVGRAGGQEVHWMVNGEPYKEHFNPDEKDFDLGYDDEEEDNDEWGGGDDDDKPTPKPPLAPSGRKQRSQAEPSYRMAESVHRYEYDDSLTWEENIARARRLVEAASDITDDGEVDTDDDRFAHYFKHKGKEYRVHAAHEGDGHWYLAFQGEGKYGLTHDKTGDAGGDAIPVMRHIRKIIHGFVKKKNPESLEFSGYDHDTSKGGRQKVYNRFAKDLADTHGFDVDKREYKAGRGTGTEYFLKKKKPLVPGSDIAEKNAGLQRIADRETPPTKEDFEEMPTPSRDPKVAIRPHLRARQESYKYDDSLTWEENLNRARLLREEIEDSEPFHDDYSYVHNFKHNGDPYTISAYNQGGTWGVDFTGPSESGGSTYKKTGRKGASATEVMRHIGNSLHNFVKIKKPEGIEFSASDHLPDYGDPGEEKHLRKDEEGRTIGSRQKLYNRFADSIVNNFGYALYKNVHPRGHKTVYSLTRLHDANEVETPKGKVPQYQGWDSVPAGEAS